MDPFRSAVVEGRCPRCGKGALFKGWLALEQRCDVCGSVYHRDEGNWTAPTAFGYGIGAATAALMLVVLWGTGNLGDGAEYLIAGVSVAVTLASFRFVKAWWVVVLYRMGHVYPDPVDRGASEQAS